MLAHQQHRHAGRQASLAGPSHDHVGHRVAGRRGRGDAGRPQWPLAPRTPTHPHARGSAAAGASCTTSSSSTSSSSSIYPQPSATGPSGRGVMERRGALACGVLSLGLLGGAPPGSAAEQQQQQQQQQQEQQQQEQQMQGGGQEVGSAGGGASAPAAATAAEGQGAAPAPASQLPPDAGGIGLIEDPNIFSYEFTSTVACNLRVKQYYEIILKSRPGCWQSIAQRILASDFQALGDSLTVAPMADLRQATLYMPWALLQRDDYVGAVEARKGYLSFNAHVQDLQGAAASAGANSTSPERVQQAFILMSASLDEILARVPNSYLRSSPKN